MNSTVTLKFVLPDEKLGELEDLMVRAGIASRKDLINNALTLLEWVIKEKEEGRTIVSLDPSSKRYKEIVMPFLKAIPSDSG